MVATFRGRRRLVKDGFFITLEGPEGAGKSTHAKRLAEVLRRGGYDVRLTREPGGTPLGEELRRLIKHFGGPETVCAKAELLMFGACRAQLMHDVILPHLTGGGLVVCDRFADSTTVYQGCARGLDRDFIARMHELSLSGRWPNLTLLLDVPAEQGLERSRLRDARQQASWDRIEAEPGHFHEVVRQGFLRLAAECPQRIKVVNATAAPNEVHRCIMEIVEGVLGSISS